MKRTGKGIVSVVLTLALAFALAVPTLGAYVEPTGISLNRNQASMAVGTTLQLVETISPKDSSETGVTWNSSDKSVATVDGTGRITALKTGRAVITVYVINKTSIRDSCEITVTDEVAYATSVTITSRETGSLPVGSTRTLEATVSYSYGADDQNGVNWYSSNESVATVSGNGVVTGLRAGEVTITAESKDFDDRGNKVEATYRLEVKAEENSTSTSSADVLELSSQQVSTFGGLYVDKILRAPTVAVKNGSTDVTENYTITYTWTDAEGKILGSGTTQKVALMTQAEQKYTCLVTAVSKSDPSKNMSKMCNYTVSVFPSCEISGDVTLAGGTGKLLTIKDNESGLSIEDQLTTGIEGSATTPGIPGLTYVNFDTSTITGSDKGSLNLESSTNYYLWSGSTGKHLIDVEFTPLAAGVYTIDFTAYGEAGNYFGQLELRVAGSAATDSTTNPTTNPSTDSSTTTPTPISGGTDAFLARSCDSLGYRFLGSDFFHYNDADPVSTVDFGTPVRGKLLRDFDHGTGTSDKGEKYYTDSAADGKYHISTLTYLPKAGSSGTVAIPATVRTRSGKETSGYVQIAIQNKTDSANFTDVTKDTVGTWAADSVDFAYGCGLMGGMGEGLFGPYESMTRGMLVTVLYRAAGSPTLTSTSTRFRDLDSNAYYYRAVLWANSRNIVNGVETTRFAPDSPVTREQIAVILYRYAEVMGGNTESSGNLTVYTDRSQVDSYAVNAMTWAVSNGIITGTTATTLSPLDYATRAQVTVMLHRYLTL